MPLFMEDLSLLAAAVLYFAEVYSDPHLLRIGNKLMEIAATSEALSHKSNSA
jgi:hypothetical protein